MAFLPMYMREGFSTLGVKVCSTKAHNCNHHRERSLRDMYAPLSFAPQSSYRAPHTACAQWEHCPSEAVVDSALPHSIDTHTSTGR